MHGRSIAHGLIAGAVGLAAMELAGRLLRPLVKARAPRPTDVFLTERSISPLGPRHERGEDATAALARHAYQKLAGRTPPAATKRRLSWAVHIGYGLLVAALYVAARGGRPRHPVRDGLVFGAGLWLVGDELAVPLLGLADKPTAYHPTQHLQALARHLGFGVATAEATRFLEQAR
jgi:hypothetical protein